MEYSFSQTFGRGGIIFHTSQTSSHHSSIDAQKSRSKSKKTQEKYQRSPVIASYPIADLNGINNQKIKKLKPFNYKETKQNQQVKPFFNQSKSLKLKQRNYQQKRLQIQQKIKNVDGINERMVNLIKQLRQSQQKYNRKTFEKEKDKITPQRSQSSKIIKNNIQANFSSEYDSKANFSSKKKANQKYTSKNQQLDRDKLNRCSSQNMIQNVKKYKQRLDLQYSKHLKQQNILKERLSINNNSLTQKQNSLSINKNNNGLSQLQKRLNIMKQRQKTYASQMYDINKSKILLGDKKIGASYDTKYQNANNNSNYLSKPQNSKQFNYKTMSKNGSQNKQYKQEATWLKNKVKTIQSQMQGNIKQFQQQQSASEINKISFIEQSDDFIKEGFKLAEKVNDKQKQQEQTIYLGLFDKNQYRKKNKCDQCGLLNKNQKIVNSTMCNRNAQHVEPFFKSQQLQLQKKYNEDRFENKLRNITQKIESYQRKVENLNLNMKRQDRLQRLQQIYKKKQRNYAVQFDMNKCFTKTDKNSESANLTNKKDNHKQNKQNLSYFYDQKQHERKITPTWGYEAKNIIQQTSPITAKANQCNNNNYIISKQSKETVRNVKQRMSLKLGLSDIAIKLSKQIQLDQIFRKLKKQLSKLPNQAPGNSKTKWDYIYKYYTQLSQVKLNAVNIKEIFILNDQEADPFYSIAVEDLKNYQQIIKESIQQYAETQKYFNQNILHKFPRNQIEKLIRKQQIVQQNIKLDHFTIFISNITKINHKCRDIYLFYKRIIQNINKKSVNEAEINEGVNVKQLINILSFENQINNTETQKEKEKKNDSNPFMKKEQIKIKSNQNQSEFNKEFNETLKIDRSKLNKKEQPITNEHFSLNFKGKYR